MNVSNQTKQNIINDLRSRNVNLWGRISEKDFLNRLVNMTSLPSNDSRFENMQADYWQHRENNLDWDDDWLLDDERIGLKENIDVFFKFICELLHPSLRDADEANELKLMMNYYLKKDGIQIVVDEQYYEPGLSTYKVVEINPTQIEKSFKTTDEFVHEAYEKIDSRLSTEDYSGAITSARTLLEESIEDIYYQITGDNINAADDLLTAFKKVQKLLKLDYNPNQNDIITQLLRSFITIVNNLAFISNSRGDRHATKSNVKRHTAFLSTDTAKVFVNFMYSRMNEIHGTSPMIYQRFITELNSELRTLDKSDLINEKPIFDLLIFCDEYMSRLLLTKHINEFKITSYRDSDIFLAFLRIFEDLMTTNDLTSVIQNNSDNNQTAGFEKYLTNLNINHKELFTQNILNLISNAKYIKFEIIRE